MTAKDEQLQLPDYGEYFGPLFSSHLIGLAVFKTLKTWLPVYRGEVNRLYDAELPPIRSWQIVTEMTTWPELADPVCTIISGGIAKGSDPDEHGAGDLGAGWGLGINISITHPSQRQADDLARLYAAAVRGAIMQHRGIGLGDLGAKVRWLDEGYGSIPGPQKRTRAQGENVFAVEVEQVLNWQLGPKGEPPDLDDVPIDNPEITDVVVDDVEVGP